MKSGLGDRPHNLNWKKISLLLCVFCSAVAIVHFATRDKSEPMYDGLPLSYWITQAGPFNGGSTNTQEYRAFRAFGTNAIPTLVESLTGSGSALEYRIAFHLNKLGIHWLTDQLAKKATNRRRAATALRMLGPDASPALPLLVQAIHDDPMSPAWVGIRSIASDVPETLPTILREFQDPAYRAGLVGVMPLFTNQPQDCLPILIASLKDKRPTISVAALSSLSRFGTNAIIAAPYVTPLTTNTNPVVAKVAFRTLKVITLNTNEGSVAP